MHSYLSRKGIIHLTICKKRKKCDYMFWRDNINPEVEPHKVMLKKGDFVDTARQERKIPFKLYYPDILNAPEKLPVILWSHGLGGTRDGAGFIARFLASHKYIVLNIQHHGTDSSLWEGKPGHPWENIRKAHISRRTTLNRFKDVPFVLDQLPNWVSQNPDIGALLDLETLGMSGHSFGAITTQVMAGQMLGKGVRRYSLKQPEFKAGIAYSMSPTYNHNDDHESIYGPISIPMFYMTGTDDSSPVSGEDYRFRLPIFENAKGRDQHLMVLRDGDHMVYNGSRGLLAENPKLDLHKEIIKISALAFWDAYLKDDETARQWLTSHHYETYLSDEAEYDNRNI